MRPASNTSAMPGPPAPIRLLHLDDSPRDAALIADLLDAEGMRCEIAHVMSRELFVEALEQPAFDLILCDFNLPDFDGFSALKLAKAIWPEIPVIIVSGTINSEEAVDCLKAGATDYLLKQRLERLPSAVARALSLAGELRQRMEVEQRLDQERELGGAILNNMPGLFYLLTEDGQFLRWNRQLEMATGYSGEEIARMHPLDFFASEHKALVAARIMQVFQTGRSEVEADLLTKQGARLPYYFNGASVMVDDRLCLVGAGIDLTARMLAQKQLEESNEIFRSLARVAPAGIFRTDDQGRFTYVNRHWCIMSGLTEEQTLGQGWSIAVHPADRERVFTEWGQAVQQHQPFHSECRLLRPDGSVIWVLAQAVELTSADGRVLGHVGTAFNITAQKQTETVLRMLSTDAAGLTDEAFFQFITRKLAEILGVEFGFVGRLNGERQDQIQTLAVWTGEQFAPNFLYDLAGTPCENVVGKTLCVYPADVQQLFPADTMLADMHIVSYGAIPLHDTAGRPVGLLGVMGRRPMSDPQQIESILKLFAVRTAAEIERQHHSRRFNDLFEFAPDAIVMTDRHGIIRLVNQQVEQLFGWTRAELLGQPVELLLPLENQQAHVALRESYLHGAVPRSMSGGRSNLQAIRKDGSIFPVDISLSPLETDEGMMVAAAVRDISERVQAETQVRQSLREKETLLKEIHHRVKNNLQVISSLLAMRADTVADETARTLLLESQHRVRAMGMIHERLYQSDTLAKVDFGEYVNQLATFLHRNYATGGLVRLVVDADEEVMLNIDTAIPAGLIMNELVSNTFKHAFKDGQPHELRVLLKQTDAGVSLTVADDGPGLPAGFEIGKTESLGMELVQTLTAQLKGRLTIENAGGTRFRLDFTELLYAERH